MKVDSDFVKNTFSGQSVTSKYADYVESVGLWKSEEILCSKYFPKTGKILDVGCGAGRTTFGLYRLGYTNIEGLDLSPAMIEQAQRIASDRSIAIPFRAGSALELPFGDDSFDGALFSFNGLMQIPGKPSRVKAIKEIYRVSKPGSHFIFTAHSDREKYSPRPEYWEAEKAKWAAGTQDERLVEFGDRIIEDEDPSRDIYLHFATDDEIVETIATGGMEFAEHLRRRDVCTENEAVKDTSSECDFWVARKLSI